MTDGCGVVVVILIWPPIVACQLVDHVLEFVGVGDASLEDLHVFFSCGLASVGMLRFPILLEAVLGFRGVHRHILNNSRHFWEEAAVQVGMAVGCTRFTLDVHISGLSAGARRGLVSTSAPSAVCVVLAVSTAIQG